MKTMFTEEGKALMELGYNMETVRTVLDLEEKCELERLDIIKELEESGNYGTGEDYEIRYSLVRRYYDSEIDTILYYADKYKGVTM